jgi:hypothetical protein
MNMSFVSTLPDFSQLFLHLNLLDRYKELPNSFVKNSRARLRMPIRSFRQLKYHVVFFCTDRAECLKLPLLIVWNDFQNSAKLFFSLTDKNHFSI